MLGTGATHSIERNTLIEGGQRTAMFDRQREQIQVGDLIVAVDTIDVDGAVVAQADMVGPEFMIEGPAGVDQLRAHALQAECTTAPVAREIHDADNGVFD